MKTILVPLTGQHDLESPVEVDRLVLDAGFDLARRFEAHVKVVSLIDQPTASSRKWPIWWPSGGAGELLDWIGRIGAGSRSRDSVSARSAGDYSVLLR